MLMSPTNRPAKLHYLPNGFRVLVGGDHVFCARTGEKIALDHLRYWSVARQEAYGSAAVSTQAAGAAAG